MSTPALVLDRDFLEALLRLGPAEWDRINADYAFRQQIDIACRQLITRAFLLQEPGALEQLHDVLARIYEEDFASARIDRVGCETQPIFRDIAARLEQAVLAEELDTIPAELLAECPEDPQAFVRWLKQLISNHDAARHPFYTAFLRHEATVADLRFYLAQETNLDPRFDDILALLQLGTSGVEKMEIARNYWDEMGNGRPEEVHTGLFAECLEALAVDPRYVRARLIPEAKISGNLSACLALSRRHYFKAVGFFGATEFLVPRRFKQFTAGWRRLGLPEEALRYHDLHIQIDSLHGAGWMREVVAPLVARDPRIGQEIARGVWIRLQSSARYLDSLLAHLRVAEAKAA